MASPATTPPASRRGLWILSAALGVFSTVLLVLRLRRRAPVPPIEPAPAAPDPLPPPAEPPAQPAPPASGIRLTGASWEAGALLFLSGLAFAAFGWGSFRNDAPLLALVYCVIAGVQWSLAFVLASLDAHLRRTDLRILLPGLVLAVVLALVARAATGQPEVAVLVLVVLGMLTAGYALSGEKTLLLNLAVPKVRGELLEFSAILIALFLFTGILRDWSPQMRIRGPEFSYLIGSGAIADAVLDRTGSIPLWNPLFRTGEPLLEGPFSYVLNPLMTLPILAGGAVQGAKVGVLLHVGIMAFGGWALGYVLRMAAPGRVLLALLLAGSGSFSASIGLGFYQMALSQTYVPWVYAGLFATLYGRGRWPLALLAVSAMLLITAGTYWYVLPTAIGAALITAVALLGWGRRSVNPRGVMLRRLLLATVLTLGLAAVRWLPQVVHSAYIDHPYEYLNTYYPFLSIANLYIDPITLPAEQPHSAIHYHYILPPALLVALVLGRLLIWRLGVGFATRWRVLVPALILIVFFTVWAQERTPLFLSLYERFTILRDWRFVGRMAAAATPWIAVIAALWFDEIVQFVGRTDPAAVRTLYARLVALRLSPARARAVARLLVIPLLVGGGVAAFDVLENWNRVAGLEDTYSYDRAPLYHLRAQQPNDFLMVHTNGFFGYLPFYEILARASYGNPDYRPFGMEPTYGNDVVLRRVMPPYAVGPEAGYRNYLAEIGYRPYPGAPRWGGVEGLWYNDRVPPYAFLVEGRQIDFREDPLTGPETQPVAGFVHNFDTVEVTVDRYRRGSLLVLMETAYPGWKVRVNGESYPVESVGEMLGVALPPPQPGRSLHVVFSYEPDWLYLGGAITLVSVGLFIVYALRIDRRLRRQPQSA